MAGPEGNPGMNRLARAIDAQMKRYHSDITGDLTLDFGEIGEDWSLNINSFPKPIPKGDYYICRSLILGKKDTILTKTQEIGKPNSGTHIHNMMSLICPDGTVNGTVGAAGKAAPDPPDPPDYPAVKQKGDDGAGGQDGTHQHHVLVPEKLRSLKPGDRVLVGWVQNEVCVIDIIVSSEKL